MSRHNSFKPLGELHSSQMNPLQTRGSGRQADFDSSRHGEALQRDMDSSTSSVGSLSFDIDLQHLHQSLNDANQFAKRRVADKLPPVLMYEITSSGKSSYKNITLRELLNDVIDESTAIDEAVLARISDFGDFDDSLSASNVEPAIRSVDIRIGASSSAGDLASMGGTRPSSRTSGHPPKPSTGAGAGDSHSRRRSAADPSAAEKRFSPPHHNLCASCMSAPAATESTYEATGTIRMRDLRRLDFTFNPNEERSVLIRRHVVLFAMDPIRAVVMADRVILIVPDGADSLLTLLDDYMQEWVHANAGTGDAEGESSPTELAGEDLLERSEGSTSSADALDRERSVPMRRPSTASTIALPSVGDVFRRLSHTAPAAPASTAPANPASSSARGRPSTHAAGHQRRKRRALNTHDVPFEMHAFEALLTTVMALEAQEFNRVNAHVQHILSYFRSGSLLPIEIQEHMRNRKNELLVMQRRISSARAAVGELTEDDEDMALMSLSTLRAKPTLYRYPLVAEILSRHDEVEELLESYLVDFSSLESKVELTRSQIENAEDLLSLRLDTSRNELLITNTALAVLACCFGLGAYVTGIFGMNLDNTGRLQSTPHVFVTVIVTSFVGMAGLFFGLIHIFRKTGIFPARVHHFQSQPPAPHLHPHAYPPPQPYFSY